MQGSICSQGPKYSPLARALSPSSSCPEALPPAPAQLTAAPPCRPTPNLQDTCQPFLLQSPTPHTLHCHLPFLSPSPPLGPQRHPARPPTPMSTWPRGSFQDTRQAQSPATAAPCTEQGRRAVSFHTTYAGYPGPLPHTRVCAHTHTCAHTGTPMLATRGQSNLWAN